MKIIVNRDSVLSAMKKASKIANGKGTIQIFSHVAIEFENGICTLTANDGTRTYSERFDAEGDPGNCTLESSKLLRALNGMKAGEVQITKGNINQGRTSIKLETMDFDMFPVPDYDKAESVGLSSSEMFACFSVVSHALPSKDIRAYLNGVHLTNGFCVATDGLRLAKTESSYNGPDIIIPSDSVKTMPDIVGDVMVSDNQMIIDGDNARYSTALVDAKFPDWRRILPKEFDLELTVKDYDILSALKTEQIGGDVVKIDVNKNLAVLSNSGAKTECEVISEGSLTVAFMAQYLIDAIGSCESETITMQMGVGKACLINDNFVVMPIRL